MLRNPIYSMGKYFEPEDLYEEMLMTLLARLAIIHGDGFSNFELDSIIDTFHEFIADFVCIESTVEGEGILNDVITFKQLISRAIGEIMKYYRGVELPAELKNFNYLIRSTKQYMVILDLVIRKALGENYYDRLYNTYTEYSPKDWNQALNEVARARSKRGKGKKLEDLAEILFNSVDGLYVTGKNVYGEKEEIDLYVANSSFNDRFWCLGGLFVVECKNRPTKKARSFEIREFATIMATKGITGGFYISRSGFTRPAIAEIAQQYYNGRIIVPLSFDDIQNYSYKTSAQELLEGKIDSFLNDVKAERDLFGYV